MPKLTETYIRKLPQSKTGTAKHWDSEVKGLVMFVGKRASTWYFQKDVGGQTRRVLIGRYPVITADAAPQTALGFALEWGSNETLAKALAVDVRTVQRYIKELKATGWVEEVDIPRRRRGLKLVFPGGPEHDNEDDRGAVSPTSILSPKHDKTVVPYNKDKEPIYNQRHSRSKNQAYPVCHIACHEKLSISEWLTWLAENASLDGYEAMKAVKQGDLYLLPSRFPSEDPAKHADYVAYFKDMIAEGRLA